MKKLLDVYLYGDEIVFSDGHRRPVFMEERKWFQNRKLKAVKLSNGDYKILRFCDYHRHSGYSLLDGCVSIKEMVVLPRVRASPSLIRISGVKYRLAFSSS